MSFLKKLFGKKKPSASREPLMQRGDSTQAATTQPTVKAHKQGTIEAFDKFGRQITITRDDWLNSVLLGNLEKAWDDPEPLAQLIAQSLQDEFFHEIEKMPPRNSQKSILYLHVPQSTTLSFSCKQTARRKPKPYSPST